MIKFSILINSCDKYSDAWFPFFRLLEKNWPQATQYPIYINTETKRYEDSFFYVKVINAPCKDMPWGKRLKNALSKIESDYVLFLLEDYFFESQVPEDEIFKCLSYFENNPHIAMFSLTSQQECLNSEYCKKNENECPGFVVRKQNGSYKMVAGPALWRKSALVKWTLDSDTPWRWEVCGSIRTHHSKDLFYGRCYNAKTIFDYDIDHGGAIHRGKWVGYKMNELMRKYSFSFDLGQREVVDDWMKGDEVVVVPPIYKRLPSIAKNRYHLLYSYIYSWFHR